MTKEVRVRKSCRVAQRFLVPIPLSSRDCLPQEATHIEEADGNGLVENMTYPQKALILF